jgi:hypothetical protein
VHGLDTNDSGMPVLTNIGPGRVNSAALTDTSETPTQTPNWRSLRAAGEEVSTI